MIIKYLLNFILYTFNIYKIFIKLKNLQNNLLYKFKKKLLKT